MYCSRVASVASRAHILQEWVQAAPSPRCAARVPEPTNPVITCMVCQAMPRCAPQCSDHTHAVCCGGLLLWQRREALALRNGVDHMTVWPTPLAAGRITPHISHRLPLEQAATALKLVMTRQVIGKAVL